MGNLANLEGLSLGRNQLSGEIPPELGNLANLTSLGLTKNNLSGEIPPELGSLANLTALYLSKNNLSGEIPPELGNLANLKALGLSASQLSGKIPPELGNLTKLKWLGLGESRLGGCIPGSLQDQLDIDRSSLGGLPFCGSTAAPATDREALVAIYNATDGPDWQDNENWLSNARIGEWSGVTTNALSRVTELRLHENQLIGEIPPELGSLASLQRLVLSGNQLSGEIPPELGKLASLEHLELQRNQLSGEIPPELGNLPLRYVSLLHNQLSGCIPGNWERALRTSDIASQLPYCLDTAEPSVTEPSPDREAVVALYNSTGGPKWVQVTKTG